MKFLRDIAMTGSSSSSTARRAHYAGTCSVCGWRYSVEAFLRETIRHFEQCEFYNPEGRLE